MEQLDFTGQTLDGKYQMTRELGRGGMGTVYLATHLGTERPVAIKVIAPQYMQRAEFVERFRREARAAGRLRHPNVVDVTDFGFADTNGGQVAYLVMEYLDGCTLGEILDEEHNLPVGWTLDILEQVCSAVHEAHCQGIIHRDLKPDNIWLEPNQRGGYTVKVLDFGIAKLEEHDQTIADVADGETRKAAIPTFGGAANVTFGGADESTLADSALNTQVNERSPTLAKTAESKTFAAEAGTVLLTPASEGETKIYSGAELSEPDQETTATRVSAEDQKSQPDSALRTSARSLYDSSGSVELTRVGAVLGTPLYMSPEQCRGEHLDPRSDIYSLGVIAYQMLSGRTPFEGDFKDVMEAHKSQEPPPLRGAKRVRRKLCRAIHSALQKEPNARPQTAEAFASVLRAREEGVWGLFRRSMVIYSEHLPKFLALSTFFSIPIIILSVILLVLAFLKVSEMMANLVGVLIFINGFFLSVATAFCTNLIVGSIAWIVIQYFAVPLRPARIRPALKEARKKWKRMAGASVLTAILPFVTGAIGAIVGAILLGFIGGLLYFVTESFAPTAILAVTGGSIGFVIGFFGSYVSWMLVSPIVMLENVRVVEALRRSRQLVKRSFATAIGAALIMFVIPAVIAGLISFVVNISAKAFDPKPKTEPEATSQTAEIENAAATTSEGKKDTVFGYTINEPTRNPVRFEDRDMRGTVRKTALESMIQILWLPMQIFVFSFSAIIVALLYLKTRLAGGESMNDLIERFEDDGRPRKKWQERVRQRLIQSGRISSKPSNPE